MHITLNGDAREFPLDTTVVELLDTLGYAGKRVAVERNGEIVPKSQHAQTTLADGDQIEIVVAVGGAECPAAGRIQRVPGRAAATRPFCFKAPTARPGRDDLPQAPSIHEPDRAFPQRGRAS